MKIKDITSKIFHPHIAVFLILLPISITLLTLSLLYYESTSIFAILSYLLASYMLIIISLKIPKLVSFLKKIKENNKYAKLWFSDVQLRMKVSLYLSVFWNTAYALLQLGLGIYHKSLWFFSMFAYYLLLTFIRFFLADYTKKYKANENQEQEIQKSLLCGCLLLCMNLALAVIITFIVLQYKTFQHSIVTTITLATYTFFTFTYAIVNCIRFRKYKSLVYSSAKSISLITASVSMLTLESTMLSTFGGTDDLLFCKIMLSVSGAVVIAFALSMAIIIIVKAGKKYKQFNNHIQSPQKPKSEQSTLK